MTGVIEENRNAVFCRGESMRLLFRPGDWIHFAPCRVEDLRQGDVVIFIPPGGKERIVHRVISTGPDGIRSKGDANSHRDAWDLKQEYIAGRAVSVERRGRVISVAGGLAGHVPAQVLAQALCLFKKLDHGSSRVLHPVYRRLSRSGLARRLVPPSLAPRVITLNRPERTERQILMRRKVVGQCLPGESAWRIRRPFRLFVGEHFLD
jgi:hypothetical protein